MLLRLGSNSASLIRRALRAPPDGDSGTAPLSEPFPLPSFLIFCSPDRYRLWRGAREPSVGCAVSSGDEGTESRGDIGSPGSRSAQVCSVAVCVPSRSSSSCFWSYGLCCSTSECRRALNTSDSPRRKFDSRGDGFAFGLWLWLPSELAGVFGLFEYGEEVGEFGKDAIEWSTLVAGEDGVERAGLPLRLFGRGGGGRPPPAGGREGAVRGMSVVVVNQTCRLRPGIEKGKKKWRRCGTAVRQTVYVP
ncbi:hypothetical protein OH77DRAFT_397017 [Trametes cingulata]|nr:hypothetical protein OH77DRAFT_397017 [Trametes cingulata]